MSVPQRINDFTTSLKPESVCDKCIAKGIGLINDKAHPAQNTNALATTSDFIQEPGICSICKSYKKVIRRA